MADRPATTAEDAPAGRRLSGQTAVVTGAGGGIGAAVARRLAAEGAKVVCADLEERAGLAVARTVGGLFVHTDTADPAMVEALFDQAYETCGSVDVAFHDAGPVDGYGAQQAHLTAVHRCCLAALPYMRRHGRGSIINAVRGAGWAEQETGQVAYAALRGGVLELSRELGLRFGPEGIRVNVLTFGPVDGPAPRGPAARDRRAAADPLEPVPPGPIAPDPIAPGSTPLGRLAAPAEIAAAVAFLAGDDASFVTASELVVDGGISGDRSTGRRVS